MTVAGVYGPNASGKSTVLEALAWLSFAVRTSLHSWYRFVPRFPHRFGDGPDRPSTFEADVVVDGVRHGYRLEVDDSAVLYESLLSYPERRRRTLFERDPSTTMLMPQPGHCMTASGPDPTTRRAFVELLRFAEPEIDDVTILSGDDPEPSDPRRQLRFVRHDGGEPVLFELGQESAGTQAWFTLLGPAFAALVGGQVLLFDEIDASLHPRLSARLIELFQDSQTNPYGAQLIFTTHDTSLLGALNRDEVWLTEKASGGATRLVALAEFGGDRVRRSLNLERAYLQGRFGTIPDVDQADLRNAIGVALDVARGARD